MLCYTALWCGKVGRCLVLCSVRCDKVKCDTVGGCFTALLWHYMLWHCTMWWGEVWKLVFNVMCCMMWRIAWCDTVWCIAVWHCVAVTDHPDPNTHNPSNTHRHILWQLENKIHSSAFLVDLKFRMSAGGGSVANLGSHSVTNWPKLSEGFNTLESGSENGVGMVRGQRVSPTAKLVVRWTGWHWESTWSHL